MDWSVVSTLVLRGHWLIGERWLQAKSHLGIEAHSQRKPAHVAINLFSAGRWLFGGSWRRGRLLFRCRLGSRIVGVLRLLRLLSGAALRCRRLFRSRNRWVRESRRNIRFWIAPFGGWSARQRRVGSGVIGTRNCLSATRRSYSALRVSSGMRAICSVITFSTSTDKNSKSAFLVLMNAGCVAMVRCVRGISLPS